MKIRLHIILPLLILVMICSCTDDLKYEWPPDAVADSTLADSLNAAYDYELAESLLVWEKFKSPAEILLKLDSLHGNPNPVLIAEISIWVEENEEAIQAMLRGAQKPYCDFSFGNPRPYQTHNDRSRIYPELWNVLDLLIFKSWQYHQIDEPDSAIYMISSGLNVLSHLDNQVDGVFIAKLVEMLSLQHIARALKYSLEHSEDVLSLQKILSISERYLQNRNNMDKALLSTLFMRVDFRELAENQMSTKMAEISDSLRTRIDFPGFNIEQSTEEISNYAEDSYLKGTYKFYNSYSTAFTENNPSKVEFYDGFKFRIQIYWFTIKMGVKMLFFNREKPKFPTKIMGRFMGVTMHSVARPDYRSYIECYHLIDAELRISLRATEIKLSKLKGIDIETVYGLDPFNHFEQLKEIDQDDKFLVYSLGPDRKDGKGRKLNTYQNDQQNWTDYDLGFEYSW